MMSTLKTNGIVTEIKMNKQNTVYRIYKTCWYTIASFVILAAVLSSLVRALTPWVSQYKKQFEHVLTNMSGHEVHIEKVESGWYWFEPVIRLNNVSIDDTKKQLFKLNQITVGIDLFQSILNWKIQPGIMKIDGASIEINQDLNSSIFNLINNENASWLLKQKKFILNDIDLKLKFTDGTIIPLSGLNLSLINKGNYHFLTGVAELAQMTKSQFRFSAKIKANPHQIMQSQGEFYLDAKHILLAQWLNFFNMANVKVDSGIGRLKLWGSIESGVLTNFQSRIKLENVDIVRNKQRQLIQKLNANLEWQLNKTGWNLRGDNLYIRAGGIRLPQNKFLLNYNKKKKYYRVYLKFFDLSLLDDGLKLALSPSNQEQIRRMDLKGTLNDSQFIIKESKLIYALTRFKGLSQNGFRQLPAIDNLSGALFWQPNQGHLELDSQEVLLSDLNEKPIKINTLSGIFDWRKLSHGWRLTTEKLIIKNNILTISSRFSLDDFDEKNKGFLNLSGEFSGKTIEELKKFIPYKKLKPKLSEWLENSVLKVDGAAGTFKVKGNVDEFPYDKNNGIFSIDTHVSGVDLIYAKGFPKVTKADGRISVNQRTLSAEIHHASFFKNIDIDRVNMTVDFLGQDKEVLYLHGQVDSKSNFAFDYVKSSPLKKVLAELDDVKLQGNMSLNLDLEIPLYPENTLNLAQGNIVFQNNEVLLKRWGNLKLDNLNGKLSFNQEGVKLSKLSADAYGFPLTVSIVSKKDPKKMTQVSIDGDFTINTLKKKIKLPIFEMMQGQLHTKTEIKITEDKDDFDKIRIHTNLKGVRVNLPKPLDKPLNKESPLLVSVDFSPKKGAIIHVNYNNSLSSALKLNSASKEYSLSSGEIRFGSGKALLPSDGKFQIIGSIDAFNLEQWLDIKRQVESKKLKKYTFIDKLSFVDLRLNQADIYGYSYPKLTVKGINKRKYWDLYLHNKIIKGRVTINHDEPMKINAILDYWKLNSKRKPTKDKYTLKAKNLSPISLMIKDLSYDDVSIGELNLNTIIKNNILIIKQLKIHSPLYEMRLNGSWKDDFAMNKTSLSGSLYTQNLAGILKQLSITPAIEARKGEVDFDISWHDSPANFSLKTLNGDIEFVLRNGRITHLDKGTEDKLALGKLLSILSLQTLPRRLVLDFSDLSKDGFSYDIFKGNFKINKGVVKTNDSYIDGPVAYVSMKGALNLEKKKYDVILKVAPHITASLPVVATIAGGPVAGIATWVASKIINQSMKKVSAYTYKITGPWEHPVVQQISITQARNQ
jgi:uncharacterized protein (TIGR02099 family)